MKNRFAQLLTRIPLSEGALPARVPLHPFGEFTANSGSMRFRFDADSLERVKAQLREKGVPFVIDLHHATLKVEEGKAAEAPAMGFIHDVEVEGDTVYGVVEWTPLGQEKAAQGGFGFISPVLYYTEDGHVVGYHSHALTNRPGTDYQRRIGLEERMDWLKQMLGLGQDATEEQVKAALEALQGKARLGDLLMQALELSSTEITPELRGRVIRMAANEQLVEHVNQLRQALEAQASERKKEQVETLIRQALEDGRIPAQDEARIKFWRDQAAKDLEGTKAALEMMPKLVPTAPITTPAKPADGVAALEAADLQVAKLVGLSEEELKKYGGK